MQIGIDYDGSPDLLNSGEGNLEIIPIREGTDKPYSFYKFEFKAVESPVIVKINGKTYYRENGYFAMDRHDPPIYSFVVVDENINFSWMGSYK